MKKNILLLFIFTIVLAACGTAEKEDLGTAAESDVKTMVTGNNELAFNLLDTVEADDNGNLFISPLSLHIALSMVYNGADSETLTEIGAVLGWEENDKATLNLIHANLMKQLTAEQEGIDLNIANSIWLNEAYTFQEKFKEDTLKYYDAEIDTIDLSDKSAKRINDWVSDKTNDRIKDIVEPPLSQNLVTLLINTIYFNSDWTYPFDPNNTVTEDFYLPDGSVTQVDMMSLSMEFEYFETNDFQAVKLPYGEKESLNMQIILPSEEHDFSSISEIMTTENWQDWQNQYAQQQGIVNLPNFELEYEIVLNDTLKQLGMPTAFTGAADFSHLVEETKNLEISEVKQKTFLKVDEEGTKAAAATSIAIEESAAPIDDLFIMKINRPFLIFITDVENEAILFNGYIQKPLKEN